MESERHLDEDLRDVTACPMRGPLRCPHRSARQIPGRHYCPSIATWTRLIRDPGLGRFVVLASCESDADRQAREDAASPGPRSCVELVARRR